MNKKEKFFINLPRILAVLFICFISLFALDIFDLKLGFWGTIVGLFMHLIPSFVLIIITILAWRWDLIGTGAFLVMGIAYAVMAIRGGEILFILPIALPLLLISALFIKSYFVKKRKI